MGAHAGILLGISFCLAWAVTFGPKLVGNRRLMRHVAIVTGSFTFCWGLLLPGHPAILVSFYSAVIILVLYAVIGFVFRLPIMVLPIYSMFFLIMTLWAPVDLHAIARSMWSMPGSVPIGGAGIEVAAIDVLAIAIAALLSVLLRVALAKRRNPTVLRGMAIGTVASTVLSGIAFYYTVPRKGDIGEGLLFMFILIPAALIIAAITLVMCITVLVAGGTRAKAARGRMDGETSGT